MDGRNPFQRSTTRVPGPTLAGATVHAVATRPIVWLDSTWSAAEQAKLLAALQGLTDDKLTQTGLEIFTDLSGAGTGNRKVGETLLRGLQHPTSKVIIVPLTTSILPETRSAGSDILVEMTFSGADLATFHFFNDFVVLVPTPGISSSQWPKSHIPVIEKAPGWVPLAHELVHAFRMLRSVKVPGSRAHEFQDPDGYKYSMLVSLEELTVVGIDGAEPISENTIRAEQGLKARASYASPTAPLDLQGVKPISAPAGKPLPPVWWPICPTPP